MSTIGLLESVRKYHPRKGTDPLENFITEAFAWMLNDCPEFGTHFVNEILKNLDFPDFDSNNIRWETQMNFDGVFPDMVCHSMEDSSARKALVFFFFSVTPLFLFHGVPLFLTWYRCTTPVHVVHGFQ